MRPSWDEHFMKIVKLVAEMSTCVRRKVGCVIVDAQNVILSTGFNGVPRGFDHCGRGDGEKLCPGADLPSGTGLDSCLALHSEMNGVLFLSDRMAAKTIYCTCSPCISCVKLLLGTGISRVVFLEEYPHPESRELWTRTSLLWRTRTGMLAEHRTWEQLISLPGGAVESKVLGSSGLR
jgi:dCMP deaminase